MTNLGKGKRTYLLGGIVFVLGGLEALGFDVPNEVFIMLAGAGAWTLRAAVQS